MLKNNLFSSQDLPLIQLSHTYAECSVWLAEKMDKQIATFDLVVRDMPTKRNYLVFAGLEELLAHIKEYRFSNKDIATLKAGKLITPQFAKYLKTFKFTGDIYSLPEGSIFFPGEPIIRITAPIIEASIIEIMLLNIASSNIGFMTKAARVKTVMKDKVVGAGLQRARSFESGLKGVRCGYIAGMAADAWPTFVKKYFGAKKKEYVINAQHLFIKSFPNEPTAFAKIAKYFPANTSLMIDTYDFKQGLKNAIKLGKKLKAKGHNLRYVTIDAGNLEKLAKYTRKELDKAGLKKTSILIASNLDEYKIDKLIKNNTPFDYCVTATEYISMPDSPKLEVVYKLAELRDGKNIQYTAKLTPSKESYPARKQVFRKYKNNKLAGDIVGLENEKLGTPMLKKYMSGGKVVKKMPGLPQIKKYFDKQFATLPDRLKDIHKKSSYPVSYSPKLKRLFQKVKKQHTK